MFLFVKDVLNASEIEQIRQIARTLKFVDGRQSNPHNLAKKNLQADPGRRSGPRRPARRHRDHAQRGDQEFRFPKRLATPLLSRYQPGMNYGPHAERRFCSCRTGRCARCLGDALHRARDSDEGASCIHLGNERHSFKASRAR